MPVLLQYIEEKQGNFTTLDGRVVGHHKGIKDACRGDEARGMTQGKAFTHNHLDHCRLLYNQLVNYARIIFMRICNIHIIYTYMFYILQFFTKRLQD